MKKNKIVMALTNDLIYDSRVTKMATTLSKKYEVVVVCIDQGRNVDYSIFPFKVVSVKGDFIVKSTQSIRKKGRVLPPIIKNILKEFSLYIMLRKNSRSLENDLLNEKGDIYVANDLETLEVICNVALSLNAKIVYDSHELCPECYSHSKLGLNIWRRHEQKLLPFITTIITTNIYRASIIKEHYNLNYIPYIINNIPLKSSSFFKETNKVIHLVYVGGLSDGRGLLEFIYAMKKVPENYHLNFIGQGGLKSKMEKIVSDNKLSKKVTFHNPVKSHNVVNEISKFDIGIVTYIPDNLNNYYCSPNKLYEYIQAGLSIISIDLPEPNNVINICKNGYLFKEYTDEDISNTIKKFNIKNINLFKQNSIKAIGTFNWENQEELILKIYDEVNKNGKK